jgi:hypothetical protein
VKREALDIPEEGSVLWGKVVMRWILEESCRIGEFISYCPCHFELQKSGHLGKVLFKEFIHNLRLWRKPMLDKAIGIAVQAHLGQKDKYGNPYILHPLRMMLRFRSETEMMVAVLHDVVEDNPEWSFDRLHQEGFSEEIIEAVDHLTRRQEETYEEFSERAGKNALARKIKLADLEDNMDLKRIKNLTEKDMERLTRYHQAWLKLSDSI